MVITSAQGRRGKVKVRQGNVRGRVGWCVLTVLGLLQQLFIPYFHPPVNVRQKHDEEEDWPFI